MEGHFPQCGCEVAGGCDNNGGGRVSECFFILTPSSLIQTNWHCFIGSVLSSIPSVDLETNLFGLAAAVFGSETAFPASTLSCVNLAAAVSLPVEGMHCVAGGYMWLLSELTKSVRFSGGRVIADVPVLGIDVEPAGRNGQLRGERRKSLRATGVRVGGLGTDEGATVRSSRGVVSGVGALCTYTRLLPASIPSPDASGPIVVDRSTLSKLREACPKIHVLISMPSQALALFPSQSLFAGEYIELNYPPSPPPPGDEHDGTAGLLCGSGFVRVWSPDVQAAQPGSSPSNKYVAITLRIITCLYVVCSMMCVV
jgi:hypothetical protein